MNLPITKYFKYGKTISKVVKAKNCFGFEYDKVVYKCQSYRQLNNEIIEYFKENNISEKNIISYIDTCDDACGVDDSGSAWFEKRGGITIVYWKK